jgi:hypothetical protein
MTFRVIRRTNRWDFRGNEIQVRREVVFQSDDLGPCIAHAFHANDPVRSTWGENTTTRFVVCDLYDREYFLDDLWEQMLLPDRFAATLLETGPAFATDDDYRMSA